MTYAKETTVSVEKTRVELDRLLAKHGAAQRLIGVDDKRAIASALVEDGGRADGSHAGCTRRRDALDRNYTAWRGGEKDREGVVMKAKNPKKLPEPEVELWTGQVWNVPDLGDVQVTGIFQVRLSAEDVLRSVRFKRGCCGSFIWSRDYFLSRARFVKESYWSEKARKNGNVGLTGGIGGTT